MLKRLHPFAGVLALLTILTFWMATILAETFGATATVVAVKTAIPWGFLLLIRPSRRPAGLVSRSGVSAPGH